MEKNKDNFILEIGVTGKHDNSVQYRVEVITTKEMTQKLILEFNKLLEDKFKEKR